MSWYSDGEKFDEHDDPYCVWKKCTKGNSKEECDKCLKRVYAEREEDESRVLPLS